MPFVMNIAAMPLKFFPTAGMIALYIEGFGTTRFIHMDGRKHSESPNPTTWVSHWTLGRRYAGSQYGGTASRTTFRSAQITARDLPKDSLLNAASVASSALKGYPIYGKHGPDVRFVERMRLKNFNTLEIQTTVYDDTVFSKPYTFPARTWHRYVGANSEPQEWYCTDNRDFVDPETGKLEYDVKDKATSR
jgi:hypothetical protein